jgi:hypothetical protein
VDGFGTLDIPKKSGGSEADWELFGFKKLVLGRFESFSLPMEARNRLVWLEMGFSSSSVRKGDNGYEHQTDASGLVSLFLFSLLQPFSFPS